ncbi:MAG: precorrin-4 C(11)-methyltransferase [Methermicoccaceae archaeon]
MKDVNKVFFVGAGPGDPELITVRGKRLLDAADLVVYTGSLVSPAMVEGLHCEKVDSHGLTLEETTQIILNAISQGKRVVRLHSGDPSLYGAIVEQIEALSAHGVECEVVPGVSSLFAAAASLKCQLTLSGITDTVIITRPAGKTLAEDQLKELSRLNATLVVFLGVQHIEHVVSSIDRPPSTPVAVVHRASWDDEKVIVGTLANIVSKVKESNITRTALIIIGDVINPVSHRRSYLYGKYARE